MIFETIGEYVRFAKTYSPFYAELYKGVLPSDDIIGIPVVDPTKYWDQNEYTNSEVMTGPQIDGVVLRTGGTTSKPQFAAYSHSELQRTAMLLGAGLVSAGLTAGDRVGNLFYAGDCYGSFLLHILSVIAFPLPAIQVPIGGLVSDEFLERLIDECNVNVLLSTPNTLVKLAERCLPIKKTFAQISKVMFGGEPLFPDEELVLRSLFPRANFRSCIYGSIEVGVIATSASARDSRVHQVVPGVIAEIHICDVGQQFTQENGVEGSLIVTNLLRRLTPIIRYPTGYRAEWVDYHAGVFRLLGRDRHSARLGPVSLDVQDLRNITAATLSDTTITAFQVAILRHDGKDLLQCRVDARPYDKSTAELLVRASLYVEKPMLAEQVHLGQVAEPEIKFMPISEMETSNATGQLLELVDFRGIG